MIIGLLALAVGAPSVKPDMVLQHDIAALGSGSHSYEEIEAIARYGCRALPILVRQLRVLRPGHYSPDRQNIAVLHTMYVYAALRRLTGRDFYGHVRATQLARFSEQGRYFLHDSAPHGEAKPFGVWLSHGQAYFAPVATQRESIAGLRRYTASGLCTGSVKMRKPESDYLTGNLDG